MGTLRFFVLFLLVASVGCKRPQRAVTVRYDSISVKADSFPAMEHANRAGNGALLLTNFKSLAELKAMVQITYFEDMPGSTFSMRRKPQVCLTYSSRGGEVISILKSGISESDFLRARDGHLWDRVLLVLNCPYSLMHRSDLGSIEILGRRRYQMFGEGDVAFYDLAEKMVYNITDDDSMIMTPEDLSEKGYLNTFNHVVAQAFMTSVFSETVADFVADVHERFHMPELITGSFTEDQLMDIEDGPVDNYIDMINNEWGQELGKLLRKKYTISRLTHWTPELLANYLNDIQSYHSWVFQIGFKPFRASDEIAIRYANKINRVIENVSELRKYYN